MEKTIEFKNFELSGEYISIDLYVNDEYIVRLTDSLRHVIESKDTQVTLYEYFKKAALIYTNQNGNKCSVH